MKTAKLTLMFLACAAAIPAFAQNTTDSRCGTTDYDSSRNMFTIINPTPGTANQQCFITVVPKQKKPRKNDQNIHCRTGSSENAPRYRPPASSIHCRTGSSEKLARRGLSG